MLAITNALKNLCVHKLGCSPDGSDSYYRSRIQDAVMEGKITTEELARVAGKEEEESKSRLKGLMVEAIQESMGGGRQFTPPAGMVKAHDVFGGGSGGTTTITDPNDPHAHTRVKNPSEMYCQTKSIGKHRKTGEPVLNERGKQCENPSELEYAKAGVILKFWASRGGFHAPMNEHEKSLLAEIFEKDTWSGQFGPHFETGVSGIRVKALLSDSISGGAEVNPEWFDDMLVTFPLLHGELFPFVTLVNAPRGNSVEAASVGNPTVGWGTPSGTAIPLFNTDGLVAEINTSIHEVAAAVEVGKDLLNDAAADLGRTLAENIGQRMLAEFDRVVANGDGVTEPEGIFTASGLTAVSSDNGATGPPTVGDYESLMFAVGKQYRNPAQRPMFIANDTSYSRVRGIEVGSGDARRVFGMNHQSYQILEHPFRVQNDIANANAAFGAMSRYRMYRRQGTETKWTTEDWQLSRENKVGLLIRSRMGGRIVDANAFATITDGQS